MEPTQRLKWSRAETQAGVLRGSRSSDRVRRTPHGRQTFHGRRSLRGRQNVSGRRGQALIIGITVMFILLAIGLLFLRQALQHLNNTGISNERIADLNYARSGIDWVDHELMTSPLGADWRPQPRNLNPGGLAGYPADNPLAVLDPDFQYLRPWAPQDTAPVNVMTANGPLVYKGQTISVSLAGPSGGFMRVNFGQGRALIRVTYNPRNAISFQGQNVNLPLSTDLTNTTAYARGPWMEYGPTPLSRYVRIDAIGRFGDTTAVDNETPPYSDPTITAELTNAGIQHPYRVQEVAYKQFGLGDHLLFVTNKENEAGPFDLGQSAISTGLGPPAQPTTTPLVEFSKTPQPGDVGTAEELAGDIRVNGDTLVSDVTAFIDSPVPPGAGVDVAGAILGGASTLGVYIGAASYSAQTTQTQPTGSLVPGAGALQDIVRDNQWFKNSQASSLRTVRRLAAPSLDLARFRGLTQPANSGGLYIPNFTDMQPQLTMPSVFLSEVHSPQDLDLAPKSWANPYNPPPGDKDANGRSPWDHGNPGYAYSPPAVRMVFQHPGLLYAGDPDGALHSKYYFIRMYRDEGTWSWADGSNSGAAYLDVYYTPDALADPAVLAAAQQTSAANPRLLTDPESGQPYPAPVAIVTDHTIFAEGNISLHGFVAPGMTSSWWGNNPQNPPSSAQLSVVSRGTIYLDGSLNRATYATSTPGNPDPADITLYNNGNLGTLLVPSAIAVLAQDHVALNLTQGGAANATRVQPWDPFSGPQNQPDVDIPATEADIALQPGTGRSALHWTFDPNGSGSTPRYFRLTFSLAGVPQGTPVRLYLRHAARRVNDPNGPAFDTWVDAFLNPPAAKPTTDPFRNDPNWAPAMIEKTNNAAFPLRQDQTSLTPLIEATGAQNGWEYSSYRLDIGPWGSRLNYGGDNVIDVEVMGDFYYLSRAAALPVGGPNGNAPSGTTVSLDGAFLANEGGFYVIPHDNFYMLDDQSGAALQREPDGPFPGPMPYDYSTGNWGTDSSYPAYGVPQPAPSANRPPPANTPLLQPVMLSGSLTVNRMASGQDQARWVLLDPAPSPTNPQQQTLPPPWAGNVLRPAGPLYQFNDDLIDIGFREGGWLPMMPRLPMTPGLVYEGATPPL